MSPWNPAPPYPLPQPPEKLRSPEQRRKRLIRGALLFAIGAVLMLLGFFEMSIHNPYPTEWWALPVFAVGCILVVVGALFCFTS